MDKPMNRSSVDTIARNCFAEHCREDRKDFCKFIKAHGLSVVIIPR
jgi:hypothetical protein